ncbi:hypothetical protein [Micromonospora sp. RTGN7]|uniref:hypothetical protein n=1 Tax=Micromonospora sp. RTGN7 TaxID=3016526 RepID=UPI0029FED8D2|nr:hypothetical protein [Micromonospora sp. RTGN7]
MIRTFPAAIVVLAAVVLAGCGGDPAPSSPVPPASSPAPVTSAPKPTVDPYKAYLKIAPADAPKISREDAQARALLGCGQTWAPGTVDAALAEAYADLCKPR